MKKLMIAAAAAMAGTATFGGLCDPDAAGPDSCSVYNIKFTFKTLAAKTACAQGAKWLVSAQAAGTAGAVWYRQPTADTAALADNTQLQPAGTAAGTVTAADYITIGINNNVRVCANGNGGRIQNAALRQVFWMDNATRKFEGVAWQCKSACFEAWFADCDLTNNGRLNYVLWEKKNSLAVSYPVFQVKYGPTTQNNNNQTVFDGTPKTEYFSLDAQNEMFIGRYGKKAQKVAANWRLWNLLHGQSINAAGFGTYDVKNLRTKSVSGNAVGMIMPIQDGATDECGNRNRIFCALGFMCVEWMDWCCDGCYAGVELVPASGTWSLKYNASATKKANNNKAKLTDFVPSYMFYSHSAWATARAVDPWLHTDNYYWWDSTNLTLFYKEGGAAAGLTNDQALDHIANNAHLVIDIVFDGVHIPKTADAAEKYIYLGTDYALDDNGVLSDEEGTLFPAKPATEEGEEAAEEP